MPTLKTGEKVSWKEAMIRFKQGVDNITPLQKLTNERRATVITLVGFVLSLVVVIIKREDIGLLSYGLILIFLGSSMSYFIKLLGLRQQIKFLKNLDNTIDIFDDTNQKEELTC